MCETSQGKERGICRGEKRKFFFFPPLLNILCFSVGNCGSIHTCPWCMTMYPSSHVPVMLCASLWAGLTPSGRGESSVQLALRVVSAYYGAHSLLGLWNLNWIRLSCLCRHLDVPWSNTNYEHLKSNQAAHPSCLDQDTKVRKSKGKNRETSLLGEESCWVWQETGSAGTIKKNWSPEEIVNREECRRMCGCFCLWGCME